MKDDEIEKNSAGSWRLDFYSQHITPKYLATTVDKPRSKKHLLVHPIS